MKLRKLLWVDHDLKSAEKLAEKLAQPCETPPGPAKLPKPAKEPDGCQADVTHLDGADLERAAAFVADVARSEQDRETNLNTRGATVATVAGLIVSVSGAVAKSVFGLSKWEDWTKIAAVALFLLALFAVATSMVASVFFVLRPRRSALTRNFLGETLANLWLRENTENALLHANRNALNVLFLDRSMRTLPEWHYRNREKARWLRRSWVLLTIGMLFIAVAAVFVLARILEVTPPRADGPAANLTWNELGLMIGGAAFLAWVAIRFDLLGAGRGKEAYVPPPDIAEIAAQLSQSPVREEGRDAARTRFPSPSSRLTISIWRKQTGRPT